MGIAGKHRHVGNTVVVGARFEYIARAQRREYGITTGTPAADRSAGGVGTPGRAKKARGGNDVLDIDDAPLAMQLFTIGASEARAAAVIDVHDGKTPAGPILNAR
jgi:hypothetical protein